LSIFPTKILLATDGSEEARLAARTAADLAKSTASELHVVAIFQESAYGHPYYEVRFPNFAEQLRQQDREENQNMLDEQVERLRRMCQHPCSALTYKGCPRTNMVEVLVGKEYAPQIPHSYAALNQGSGDRLRLIR
jgi:nucleotide-binding universal stress UspA family protein